VDGGLVAGIGCESVNGLGGQCHDTSAHENLDGRVETFLG
jgi:hypothetical protein